MKKLKLTQFSDGGHSWLAVKRKLLIKLNILEKISGYSYQKGETVYLDEDCDLAIFLKAYFKGEILCEWWNQFDIKKSYQNNSPIRSYYPFNPKPIPVIESGTRFNLYGNEFKALRKDGKNWICEKTGDAMAQLYRIKASQLQSIEVQS